MLGAARASQYAGWWGGPPKVSITSVTEMTYAGQYLDAVSMTPNAWLKPDDTRTFDNTGLANGAKGTQVVTFKYAAASNFTWLTDSFRNSNQFIKFGPSDFDQSSLALWSYEYQSSIENWTIVPGRTVTGNYLSIYSTYSGYEYFTLTGNLPWDDYADRWMTLIVSYSSSSGDFVNWTGTTGGANWYQRIVLQDATTGELISVTDSRYNPFQNSNTNWANYTWSFNTGPSGSGTTANTAFSSLINVSGVNFDQTDLLTAAWWACQGTVVDPMDTVDNVPLRNYFVGQCFPETVNGSRAWFNFTPFAIVTSGSDSLLPLALPGRATQTNNYAFKQTTSNLTTPATDASIP